MGNKYSKNNSTKKEIKQKEKLLKVLQIWSNNKCFKDLDDIILKYANFVFNMKEWKSLPCLQNKIVRHRWGYFFYLQNKRNSGRIIIKTFDKTIKSKFGGNSKVAFKKESYILNKISHPNIVHMLCKYSDVNKNCIIYHCDYGGQNLFDIVNNENVNISEQLCKYFVLDMLNVYKYLELMDMYHSNLEINAYIFKYNFDYTCINCPNNYSNSLLLTNFDSCMIIKDNNKKYRRTNTTLKSGYHAPELYFDNPNKVTGLYVKTGDIFSIGVVLYATLFKSFPKHEPELSLPKTISDKCADFVSKLLEKDYKKRLNVNDALNHTWLQCH